MPCVCCVFCVTTTSQQDCGVMLVLSIPSTVASQEIACTILLFYSSLSIHSAMDAFAQTLMKDAVNCDKHSDLQNSVNQLDFEYGLCCRGCLCKHTFSIYPLLCTLTLWMAKQCWWRIWQASLMILWRAHHKRSVCFCQRLLCRVGQSYGFVIQQLWCRWKDSLNLSI